MGLQLRTPVGRQINLLNTINMNKFLAVVCLAAGAMAEAEADPYYAAYGYAGLPVAGAYGGSVYGAGVYGAGAYGAGAYGAGVYGAGAHGAYGAYPYGIGHAAGYASASPSASVSINGLAPAAVPAIAGGYAGAGRYVANSAGVVHVTKRDAEADPALLYGAYGYAGLGYAGHGYAGYPYAGLGYAGLGYAGYAGYPYAAGYAAHSPSASTHIAGLAPAALPAIAGGYAGAGRYVANSAGVVHVAKREAEADAEADPALLY